MACIYTKQFSNYHDDELLSNFEEELCGKIGYLRANGVSDEGIVRVLKYYTEPKHLKQFASTFGAPQPIELKFGKYFILGYNNQEYAIQNEKGKNILGDLKTKGVEWNAIVYWLRKQGANTSKAEALRKCVDEKTTEKGVIGL